MDRVLVTGISGFIASHVAAKLLDHGYVVRGTVRNLEKGQRVIDALAAAGHNISNIELVKADLGEDAGWDEAVKDCRYIQHIASPFPSEQPSDREALVPEARAGTQRVLEHGFSAGAERIIVTSSFLSMCSRPYKAGQRVTITEESWSDPEWKALTAYPVSKTRAELSAWAYVKAQNIESKLTTICPALVLGPDLYNNRGTSLGLIKAMLSGRIARAPKRSIPITDVRDCASLHVRAMTEPRAAGQRLLATNEAMPLKNIAQILAKAYPDIENLPVKDMPNLWVRVMAMFDDRLKAALPNLGVEFSPDNSKTQAMTKVIMRPAKEAILASAASILGR
jgi:dihydroflavonol-4-reductase